MDDFKLAIREVEPSALREIYVEVPKQVGIKLAA